MVSRLCILVAVAWTGWATVGATDYCRLTSEHTMCKYSSRGPRCGSEVGASEMSPEDAATIVALHNELRSKVAQGEETRRAPGPQPSGANIRVLAWDKELASLAQRHADQCVFRHECGDCRRVDRFDVGQNLCIRINARHGSDWRSCIQAWYNEVAHFPRSNIQSYKVWMKTGHYSQVLWANTSLIGCGYTAFQEYGLLKELYTCNYGPAGNMSGGQMYLGGGQCSSCPPGTSCSQEYEGLCKGV